MLNAVVNKQQIVVNKQHEKPKLRKDSGVAIHFYQRLS